jgi:hypothetical protein
MWDIQKSALSLNLLTIQLGSMEDLASAALTHWRHRSFFSPVPWVAWEQTFQLPPLTQDKQRDLVVFWKEGAAQLAENSQSKSLGAASPLVKSQCTFRNLPAGASLTPLDELQPPPRQLWLCHLWARIRQHCSTV